MGQTTRNTRHLKPTLRTPKDAHRNNSSLRRTLFKVVYLDGTGNKLRNKTDSQCESVFCFCLSAMYPEVELDLAEMACVPRNIRRTFLVPSLLFQILRTVKDFPVFHFCPRCLTSCFADGPVVDEAN